MKDRSGHKVTMARQLEFIGVSEGTRAKGRVYTRKGLVAWSLLEWIVREVGCTWNLLGLLSPCV